MKSIQYINPQEVAVVNSLEPKLSPGEALIKVHYAGICGTDMAIRAGKHPRAKSPLILGHEMSGTIVDLDETEKAFQVGDRVTVNPLISCGTCWSCRNGLEHICYKLNLYGIDAPGCMAEYFKVPVSKLHRLPDSVSNDKAALTEPLAVGIQAVNTGGSKAGDRVLVMGAGPIGLITAMCLRRKGVEDLMISDVCDYRLQLAAELGFNAVDIRSKNLLKEVMEWTKGDGVDAIYEVSGHPSAIEGITDLVRCRGLIMMVSVHKDPRLIDLRAINIKEIQIWGTRCYQNAAFAEAVSALDELPLEKLISHRLPVESGPEGFEIMQNPMEACKILFEL